MSYQIGGGSEGPSNQTQQAPQQMRISTTQTVTVAPTRTTTQQPTLRLRGEVRGPEERTEQGRRIHWAEDVVDNEGLGRKSSKGELQPAAGLFPVSYYSSGVARAARAEAKGWKNSANSNTSMLYLPRAQTKHRRLFFRIGFLLGLGLGQLRRRRRVSKTCGRCEKRKGEETQAWRRVWEEETEPECV